MGLHVRILLTQKQLVLRSSRNIWERCSLNKHLSMVTLTFSVTFCVKTYHGIDLCLLHLIHMHITSSSVLLTPVTLTAVLTTVLLYIHKITDLDVTLVDICHTLIHP